MGCDTNFNDQECSRLEAGTLRPRNTAGTKAPRFKKRVRMARYPGTKRDGSNWTEADKSSVWWKSTPVYGQNPRQVGLDSLGLAIRWTDYGDVSKETGWEIDHIVPIASGGSDDLSNLQPLQWRANREKGDRPW